MVSKGKPATRVINVMLDDDTYEMLERYQERHGCNRSQAIRWIIQDVTHCCTCFDVRK